jgi:hypothetical protein
MMTDQLMDQISERLVYLHQTNWIPVLHRWLKQYRGLYDCISADTEAPEAQILKLLDQLQAPIDDVVLAQRLARLDFLTWRVRHIDIPWQPLQRTFEEFNSGVQENAITLWQSGGEYPLPQETEAWLMHQLQQIAMLPLSSQPSCQT